MSDRVLNTPLDYLSCFAIVLRERLIYAKMIIVFSPNLEFSPYSELILGTTTFKLTKGLQRLTK